MDDLIYWLMLACAVAFTLGIFTAIGKYVEKRAIRRYDGRDPPKWIRGIIPGSVGAGTSTMVFGVFFAGLNGQYSLKDHEVTALPPKSQTNSYEHSTGTYLTGELPDSTITVKILMPKFQWPPPQPSSQLVIPLTRLIPSASPDDLPTHRFGEIDGALQGALDNAAYYERGYYSIPDGYLLATQLERINPDGSAMPEGERWNVDSDKTKIDSVVSYLRALFTAPKGYYRVILFAVTNPFIPDSSKANKHEAQTWISRGENALPYELAKTNLQASTTCTVLIYEFKKDDQSQPALEISPGMLPAHIHLLKSGLARLYQ